MVPQESGSVVQIGEWIVHPALDSISRGGETQKLEPRAMRLLMCLANSAGEVVSVDRLLTEVWAGVVVGSASVYETVSQLRKILGDVDPQPTYIATVPRKGYRLVASVQRGTEPATSAPATVAPPAPRRNWLLLTVVLVTCAALAYLVGFWVSRHASTSVEVTGSRLAAEPVTAAFNPPPHSIAVLPFVNLSGDKEQEYFSDGLTEELLNSLSEINELQVAARTSSFYFKGKDVDLNTIARKLNVGAILEGSVRRSAHTIRITAQLNNAVTGFHLWSKTYDRDLGDVLTDRDCNRGGWHPESHSPRGCC